MATAQAILVQSLVVAGGAELLDEALLAARECLPYEETFWLGVVVEFAIFMVYTLTEFRGGIEDM